MKDATPGLPIDVVCAIVTHPDDASRFLVAQRSLTDKNHPGLWEFPGGKIENGETPQSALIREMNEELEMVVETRFPLSPVVHDYGSFSVRLIPFVCKWCLGSIHKHEHAEVRWIHKDEIDTVSWVPADLPIVKEWSQSASA